MASNPTLDDKPGKNHPKVKSWNRTPQNSQQTKAETWTAGGVSQNKPAQQVEGLISTSNALLKATPSTCQTTILPTEISPQITEKDMQAQLKSLEHQLISAQQQNMDITDKLKITKNLYQEMHTELNRSILVGRSFLKFQ